jgi:DNA replication protein DnaC
MAGRGIPHRYLSARLDDFPEEIRKATIGSLFITGPVGVGKTRLLAALAYRSIVEAPLRRQEIYDHDRIPGETRLQAPPLSAFPLFHSTTRLLLGIRKTYDGGEQDTEAKIIERCSEVPYLALDDLGTEKPTEWAAAVLYEIVDARYNAERPIWVSSNLGLSELAGRLGDRIVSRLNGMCATLKVRGADRRQGEPKVITPAPAMGSSDYSNEPRTPVWL